MSKEAKTLQVAIDGPAGSGKSTIARALAQRLKMQYLDTGAMYRAVTLKIYRNNVNLDDQTAVSSLLKITSLTINNENRVFLDGEDVTEEIRYDYVNKLVSPVSCLSAVRRWLVERQQEIAERTSRLVMEGRDIASIVLPAADYKFYLDATLEERARRRYLEEQKKGLNPDLALLKKQMAERDYIDSTRQDSPLTRVDGAILVDTTGLSVEQVLEEIVRQIDEGYP